MSNLGPMLVTKEIRNREAAAVHYTTVAGPALGRGGQKKGVKKS